MRLRITYFIPGEDVPLDFTLHTNAVHTHSQVTAVEDLEQKLFAAVIDTLSSTFNVKETKDDTRSGNRNQRRTPAVRLRGKVRKPTRA